MTTLRVFLSRVLGLFGRRRRDGDLHDEIQTHLDLLIEEQISKGMSREAARAAAQRQFGGVQRVKEAYREQQGLSFVDSALQDFRYALRQLRKHPGLAIAAIVTLMLGIGANTAIFSVLNATTLGASAIHDSERLAIIWTVPPGRAVANETASIPEYLAFKERNRSFDALGTMLTWPSNLGSTAEGVSADRLTGARFTRSLFDTIGIQPELGRLFTAKEDAVDSPEMVVVISHRVWQIRFGGEQSVLGREILLDGTKTTIIGVMPDFSFMGQTFDFWIPMKFTRFQLQGTNRIMPVIGRLKPGISYEQAQADMDAVARQFGAEFPERFSGRGVRVQSMNDVLYGSLRRLLLVLQGAVGFVLLIACANVAGLLLIRAASQHKEVAIRCSLGANRVRIIRQFLTESLVLSVVGGALGVGFAFALLRLLVVSSPTWLAQIPHLAIDGRVLAFSTAVSLLTGLAFGIVPALHVSKSDLVTSLKEAARNASSGRGQRHVQSVLVIAQIALTLVLLVGAGLLIQSFARLQASDLGFQPDGLLSFQSRLPGTTYYRQVGTLNGVTQLDVSPVPAMLFDRERERLQHVPGVVSVAGINRPPAGNFFGMQVPFSLDGSPAVDAAGQPQTLNAGYWLLTPDFFGTMRIPLVRGRDFTAHDSATALKVVIINQAMARRFWPDDDPIGKRIIVNMLPWDPQVREIVGLVGDTRFSRFDRIAGPTMFVPHMQEPLRYRTPFGGERVQMTFVLRITQSLDTVVPEVRRAVAEVDSSLPVSDILMMEESLSRQVEVPRQTMLLVTGFGVVALLLAACGIYGVVAYSVAQRSREIGIRMALGASARNVVALVLGQAVVLVAIGLVVGLGGSLALTRFLTSMLWEIKATDPVTFVAVAALLVVIVTAATIVPTRRAIRLDPRTALTPE